MTIPPDIHFLLELEELLKQRRQELPPGSYSAQLFRQPDQILKKIAEEAGEVLLAAKNVTAGSEDRSALIHESADLFYHLLLLLVKEDISLKEIVKELQKRAAKR